MREWFYFKFLQETENTILFYIEKLDISCIEIFYSSYEFAVKYFIEEGDIRVIIIVIQTQKEMILDYQMEPEKISFHNYYKYYYKYYES